VYVHFRSVCFRRDPDDARFYEMGEQSGKTFIAREYVEGKSLSKLIRPGGLPVDYSYEQPTPGLVYLCRCLKL
jgi:hypothetical protein